MKRNSNLMAAVRLPAVALGMVLLISACATVSETGVAAPDPPEQSLASPKTSPPTSPPDQDPVMPNKSGRTVKLPASIDATGSKDVSAALQQFVWDVPNGSTIKFKAGGRYKLGEAIRISDKRGLTFAGNGATLKLVGPGLVRGSALLVQNSRNTTIRDLTIVGNHAAAGTKDALGDQQGQHGVGVHGSTNTLIENVDISRVAGDCFNIKTWFDQTDWSDGVTIRDSSCRLTGRMGAVMNGASDVLIEGNVFDDIGYAVFAFEPNMEYQGSEGIVIRDNTIGAYSLTDQFSPKLLYACDALWIDGPSTVRDVTLTRNTVAGNRSGKDGAMTGLHLKICGDRGNRVNFTITNNTASQAVNGPSMQFTEVKGVTVTGNKQPLAKGALATFPGSTGVTYEQNDR